MDPSSPSELTLAYSLTLWERIRASAWLVTQRWLTAVFAGIWVVAGASLVGLYLFKGVPLTPTVWLAALACILFMPLMLVITALLLHFNKRAREPFTYRFDDNGVHVSAVSYEYTHKWAAISHAKRLGGFLMLFFAPGCAHCLPLRVAGTPEIYKHLLELTKKHEVKIEPGT